MKRPASNKDGRQTALVWGVAAALCLLSVAAVWAGSESASSHAMFGRAGSVTVVLVGLAATVVGLVVVLTGRRRSAGTRWGIALPMAVLGGGVGALAIGSVFAPSGAADVGIGLLLAVGAVGMWVVATKVSR
jgi:hypothetical protein